METEDISTADQVCLLIVFISRVLVDTCESIEMYYFHSLFMTFDLYHPSQYSRWHLSNVALFLNNGGLEIVSRVLSIIEASKNDSHEDAGEEDAADTQFHDDLKLVHYMLTTIRQVSI